jgi:hypothetical protein
MKTVSDNHASQFHGFGSPSDGAFDSTLLGRIGDDLRHRYDDVTDAEIPRSLLDLAESIDAHRLRDGRND